MSVTYKDIDQLSQKSSLAGTEKLPVSDTEYITPDQIAALAQMPVASSQPAGGMLPNTLYNLGTLSGNTTFSMASASNNNIANHWYWTFTTPSTAPTITWPAAITSWYGGSAPTIAGSKKYEVSVLGGVTICMEV